MSHASGAGDRVGDRAEASVGDTATGRVVLYARAGCHLCDDARALLARVVGDGFHEVDVDTDAQLAARFGEEVPVVTVDGGQVGFWRIDETLLRAALANRRLP